MMRKIKLCIAAAVASFFVAHTAQAANIAVVGGKPDDVFWSIIKKGIDDARLIVEKNGGSVNFLQLQTYDNLGPDAAGLIRTAIGQNIDGIVLPDWVPEAEDEAIKAAVDAGIKVIIFNSGSLQKAQELGALNYIGTDIYQAGQAAGEYYGKKGHKNVFCINTLPGSAILESFCEGMIEGLGRLSGSGKQLPLPPSNFGDPVAVSEAIKATLLQDATIDGIITIGNADADAAAIGIAQAGKIADVKLASLNFDNGALERIKKGEQLFAVDQQGYLQSFLSVTLLAAHLDFGTDLPVRPLATGPGIVDSSNIEVTLAGVAKGAR